MLGQEHPASNVGLEEVLGSMTVGKPLDGLSVLGAGLVGAMLGILDGRGIGAPLGLSVVGAKVGLEEVLGRMIVGTPLDGLSVLGTLLAGLKLGRPLGWRLEVGLLLRSVDGALLGAALGLTMGGPEGWDVGWLLGVSPCHVGIMLGYLSAVGAKLVGGVLGYPVGSTLHS